MSTSRKSPYRHKVRAHVRKGKSVKSYTRGSGFPLTRTNKKLIKPTSSFNYVGYVTTAYVNPTYSGRLTGSGHINNWKVDGKKVEGISYDLRKDRIMFMAGNGYHEEMELVEGYKNTKTNPNRIVRITKIPKNIYRVYTYGIDRLEGRGIDSYPRRSATALTKLLSNSP